MQISDWPVAMSAKDCLNRRQIERSQPTVESGIPRCVYINKLAEHAPVNKSESKPSRLTLQQWFSACVWVTNPLGTEWPFQEIVCQTSYISAAKFWVWCSNENNFTDGGTPQHEVHSIGKAENHCSRYKYLPLQLFWDPKLQYSIFVITVTKCLLYT